MQILAVVRRRTESFSPEEFAALLDAEAEGVRVLHAEGTVRAAWTRDDVLGAVLMLEAENVDAARAALDALPLYSRGMLDAQFIPLRAYRGFGPRG
jgi:hypothetical protein